jgi:hypothetical protein
MKQLINRIPIVGPIARSVYRKWINPPKPFTGSRNFWVERYASGGNSGDGSYNKLAEFKAEIINGFVLQNNITTIIEYGCGDGNQLKLSKYPTYIGYDVSPQAISMCKELFIKDITKTFKMMEDYNNETAELTLSLDVIYHLVEENVFVDYMNRLFNSSVHFVIIYSSNTDVNPKGLSAFIKHRKFTNWIDYMKLDWKLMKFIPNKHPYRGDSRTGSFADFFIYKKE